MSGWGTIYNNTASALARHSRALARLQEQASSGMRIIRASDDPSDSNRILHLRSQTRSMDTYVKNLDNVVISLQDISSGLESVSGLLIRAGGLLTQAATGTLNQANREAVAGEIDGLLEQAVFLANQKSLGRHIFSGDSISTTPYATRRSGGKIVSVSYQGASREMTVPVAPGVEYSAMVVGEQVFSSRNRGEPLFVGATGAAAGTGTSSVTGNVYLTVSNADTTFQGAAHGLARGDSFADATLVGTHTLTINADNTIRLDSGQDVSFNPGDTDVVVTGSDGSVVYIDMSSWDAVAAQVTVVGTASLSIDGGVTTTAVTDFASDATVTDANGKVLYVDTSGMNLAGTETVRLPGTHDLFDTLIDIRDLMTNKRNFTEQAQLSLLSSASGALNEVSAHIRQNATAVGARLQAMDSLRTSLDNIQFAAKSEADSVQQADILQVATELARVQSFYQMTLATSSKLLTMSLLDYI